MRDIAGGRFSSTRCTNPLSPRYVTSASAIPGALVPRPIAQSAAARSASSLGHLEEAGADREQQDQLPARAETREEAATRILPIDFDRSPKADLGYSGWVQFDDGEIYVVTYIVDDAPKAQIRGYALQPGDFLLAGRSDEE